MKDHQRNGLSSHSSNQVNDTDVICQLQSSDQTQLLDLVSELRALGVGDHIELPQLIVVGDQSSGKSSVLEAITGFKFPTKDDLCTTFATEINLRPSDTSSASVTIEPHSSHSQEEKERLKSFAASPSQVFDLSQLINSAKAWMASPLQKGRSGVFSRDVLKVSVSQPGAPSLTLVDLPGIIQTETGQQTTEDVQVVTELVSKYMCNERSIILAVISANNDVANQIILRWARDIDKPKKRTLGIITKPDLLYEGSDSQKKVVALAKNQEEPFVFDLGWHVVRNRDYNASSPCPIYQKLTPNQFTRIATAPQLSVMRWKVNFLNNFRGKACHAVMLGLLRCESGYRRYCART